MAFVTSHIIFDVFSSIIQKIFPSPPSWSLPIFDFFCLEPSQHWIGLNQGSPSGKVISPVFEKWVFFLSVLVFGTETRLLGKIQLHLTAERLRCLERSPPLGPPHRRRSSVFRVQQEQPCNAGCGGCRPRFDPSPGRGVSQCTSPFWVGGVWAMSSWLTSYDLMVNFTSI